MSALPQNFWPSARHYAEAIQFPAFCFSVPELRAAQPAVDRLGMPLVTSGQFAYVYKLRTSNGGAFGVRCFRGFLGDREERYKAIDAHLEQHRIHALASFDYEPEGILVGGKRYPILVMEWVDGPTLDVYLDEVVHKPDVVRHIADQWLSLISDLREAGIAHGDLQHGNIIVERGRLRLVDLDGMFVPAMRGWEASEVGHQHYQHPQRDEKFFNEELDNFSALVVYLSLISIAERPQLWKKYHDENLLFTKVDFRAPEKSSLFKEIKEIGPEHRRLAEELEESARHRPFATPSLLELAEAKPQASLPLWMTAPPEVDVQARTREDRTILIQRPQYEIPNWTPWQAQDGSLAPSAIQSNTVQTNNAVSIKKAADPKDLFGNTFFYANQIVNNRADFSVVAFATVLWFASMCVSPWAFFVVPILAVTGLLGAGFFKAHEDYKAIPPAQSQLALTSGQNAPVTFSSLFMEHLSHVFLGKRGKKYPILSAFWWIFSIGWIIYSKSVFIGAIAFSALFLFLLKAFVETTIEYKRKNINSNSTLSNIHTSNASGSLLSINQSSSLPNLDNPPFANSANTQTSSNSSALSIVGNAMFGVYHKADCEWVNKIPPGRRFKFISVEEAEDKNYNPCHVCYGESEIANSKAFYQIQIQTSVVESSTNNQSSEQEQTPLVQTAPQQTSAVMFIGNRLLGIYHKPDCEWAKKIPNGKRINFYTKTEVERANYRYCHVCAQ